MTNLGEMLNQRKRAFLSTQKSILLYMKHGNRCLQTKGEVAMQGILQRKTGRLTMRNGLFGMVKRPVWECETAAAATRWHTVRCAKRRLR